MAKILALGAYFYQAALALGLLIAVARILPPTEYVHYSLFIAITQFAAMAGFAWIRLAASRFYPGGSAFSEAAQRRTIVVESLLCTGLFGAAAVLASALGQPAAIMLIGAGVSILQGLSDLQLTLLRFVGRFRAFSVMQGVRASLLAVGTVAGALVSGSLLGAIAGLLAGYVAYALTVLVMERKLRLPRRRWSRVIVREHLSYGGASAAGAVLDLLAPLGLRLTLTATLGPQLAAGALLAIDLLQRPFVLIVAALHAIQYPDIVSAFDMQPRHALARPLGRYYALQLTFALLMAAGILVILRPVELLAVAPELRAEFMRTAPLLVGLFMLRALTQTVSTTPAHLQRQLGALLALALVDCISLNAFALVASLMPGASALAIVAGAALGGCLAGLVGLGLLRRLAFELPWAPVFAAGAGLSLPTLLLFAAPPVIEGVLWSAAAASASSLLALYLLYRSLKQASPAGAVP